MNRWRRCWIAGLGLLGVGLAACAPGGARVAPLEGFSPLPAPMVSTPSWITETPGGSAVGSSMEGIVEQARRDLAARLSLPADEIRVIEARAVTWPDSSLGCPEPGRMYLQVLTPGYLVILEAQGQRYAYHAGRQGPPFLCPPDRRQKPVEGEG